MRTFEDAVRAGCPGEALLLIVDCDRQRLRVDDRDGALASYPVSTAAAGLGCEAESFKTPLGWHEIAERIGDGAPLGQVFEHRAPTDMMVDILNPPAADEDEDRILTRILRLRGREPGRNRGPGVDTFDRLIYIHGTNREDLLGRPASRGCIRMSNADILELFDLIADRPAWCWIGSEGCPPDAVPDTAQHANAGGI